MLDVAIIGGGLSGVALARSLLRRGRRIALFEARQRLGGRIVSVTCARSGMAIDLGPTWFWPDTQPLIAQLIADLGLMDFPQHDEGTVLHLRDGDGKPEPIEGKGVHNGARRLQGGMASLIDALAKDLPWDHVYVDHVLVGVRDRGDDILLTFRVGDHLAEVAARRVVLAVPPRLLQNMSASNPGSTRRRRTPCGQAELGWRRRPRWSSPMTGHSGGGPDSRATPSYP